MRNYYHNAEDTQNGIHPCITEAALQIVSRAPGPILMHIQLPDMGKLTLTSEPREDPAPKDIIIITLLSLP
ncbi:hypothetical protein HKBW3S03_01970, partial [Candidatus Hakubella thermalkaliphila]